MTRESLAEFADVDLSRVRVRMGPPQRFYKGPFWQLAERYEAEREQEAALSRGCDIFIASVHEPPPFCFAPAGVLLVLFPIIGG
jgi:hypothetical protein